MPSMLVWPITSSRLGHREESTVLYYRSTSAQRSNDTIVLYHHGHSESGGDCVPHLNSLPKRMSDAGYDVMELWMPLMNCRKMEANAGKSNSRASRAARGAARATVVWNKETLLTCGIPVFI